MRHSISEIINIDKHPAGICFLKVSNEINIKVRQDLLRINLVLNFFTLTFSQTLSKLQSAAPQSSLLSALYCPQQF